MIESEIETPDAALETAEVVEATETEADLAAEQEVTDIAKEKHAVILKMGLMENFGG